MFDEDLWLYLIQALVRVQQGEGDKKYLDKRGPKFRNCQLANLRIGAVETDCVLPRKFASIKIPHLQYIAQHFLESVPTASIAFIAIASIASNAIAIAIANAIASIAFASIASIAIAANCLHRSGLLCMLSPHLHRTTLNILGKFGWIPSDKKKKRKREFNTMMSGQLCIPAMFFLNNIF